MRPRVVVPWACYLTSRSPSSFVTNIWIMVLVQQVIVIFSKLLWNILDLQNTGKDCTESCHAPSPISPPVVTFYMTSICLSEMRVHGLLMLDLLWRPSSFSTDILSLSQDSIVGTTLHLVIPSPPISRDSFQDLKGNKRLSTLGRVQEMQ